jgi:plasmid stabilization system protein ParE
MRVRYNTQALSDLDEVLSYLAERNPLAADHQQARFDSAARRIGQNPNVGIAIRQNIRRIVVGKYLMIYSVGVDTVTIEYIRHGARRQPWENN